MSVDPTVYEIKKYLKHLFLITRSITGNGNRETLSVLSEIAPHNISEYRPDTEIYDWTIPLEYRDYG